MCEIEFYDPEVDEFLYCGFCLKDIEEVEHLIAGQFNFICEECVQICNKILFSRTDKCYNEYLTQEWNCEESCIKEDIPDGIIYCDSYEDYLNYKNQDLYKHDYEKCFEENYEYEWIRYENKALSKNFIFNKDKNKLEYNNYENINENYWEDKKIVDCEEDPYINRSTYYDDNEFLNGLKKPKEIYNYLDKLVIGQEEAKKTLSLSIYNHLKRLKFNIMMDYNLPKSNILMIGPSGSGKTFLIQSLSKILNIPFVITDATTLTEAGYVGEDVENILQKLFQNSNYDPEMTEMGIIYIDEIDKISKKSNDSGTGRDVSGEGVQQALLKLIEGSICSVSISGNRRSQNQNFISIDTTNILFICGGAFYGIDKIISERVNKSSIGFKTSSNKKIDKYKNIVECEDLVKFGLIPELIGRLPIITRLNELSIESLIKILNDSKNSIIQQYNTLLSNENILIILEEDAAEIVAKMAYKRKTGARGLRSIIDKVLVNVLFEAPSLDTLREIIIHKQVFNYDSRGPILIHIDDFSYEFRD